METSTQHKEMLGQAQHQIFIRLLPVIVCMAVLCVSGILGNMLTVIFYSVKCKRSPSAVQITCLATVDLLVCCMIIPNIVEMIINVKYNHSFLCKLAHFFGHWVVACSCLMLWGIALDRYRKICKPFVKQWTIISTQYFIVGIVVFSFFLSIRNFVNFDSIEVNVTVSGGNETTIGRYCTTRDDPGYHISVPVFNTVDFLLVLLCWVTIIVTYSHISYTLVRLKRVQERSMSLVRADPSSCAQVDVRELEVSCDLNQSKTLQSDAYDLNHSEEMLSSSTDLNKSQIMPTLNEGGTYSARSLRRTVLNQTHRKRTRSRKMAARSATERNLTFMMLTVSLLYILCFLPYFVMQIVMRIELKSVEDFELALGTQFALRLAYLNSVFNPIVYCVFNPQFRRYVKNIVLKCMTCQNERPV